MAEKYPTSRTRPARTAVAAVVFTALAAAALSGCGGADGDTPPRGGAAGAASVPAPPTVAAVSPVAETAAPAATTAAPAAPSTLPTATASKQAAAGAAPAKQSAAPKPASAPPSAAAPGCDHKMPISPDEVAVYRYTPEGGALNLIVRAGAWGCPDPDSDGPAFVPTGKKYDLPLDQAAYVTATDPITQSTTNQHIGVQELLDWLETHPDAGLVFKYHTTADGIVDTLEQEFTP